MIMTYLSYLHRENVMKSESKAIWRELDEK